MKFITLQTKTSLADLTSQLYAFNAATADAEAAQAQVALRQANPQLGKLATLPAGALVVVPDVPGVNTAPLSSVTGVSADVIAQLQQVLAAAGTLLNQAVTNQTQSAETSLSLIKNRAVINLVKPLPDWQPRLAQIASQTKIQMTQLNSAKTTQLQGLAQLGKDLGSLRSGAGT